MVVLPDTYWEAYSYYWLIVKHKELFLLRPGEEPPEEDRNGAVALVSFQSW